MKFVLRSLLLLAAAAPAARADEGMWLFNNPPRKLLKERYNFDPSDAWLEHLQKSSVRFNSGGSGSFVSPDGLVMTNHHVGLDTLQKISTPQKDYVKDGFVARTRADEVKAVDLELNVLMSIEDVTDRVNAAVRPEMAPPQAALARRAVIAAIAKESLEKTGLRSDVVTLYQGGLYHLYRYKKYTDVRLVMAPEQQIAFYGGDPDNFEYPRFDLDMCFFRVYENGQPIKCDHYLKWSANGAADGELVFVSGHPGRTNRLNTVDDLRYIRDHQMPRTMQNLNRLEVLLGAYSERSEENARRAKRTLFGVKNSRKARLGGLAGLQDPHVMAKKASEEQALRAAAAARPELQGAVAAWDRIAQTLATVNTNAKAINMLESRGAFRSQLFTIARTLVRAAAEKPKPNGARLREYADSNLPSLEFQLFSDEPIYDDLEMLTLGDALSLLAEQFGGDHPLVRDVLAGQSPRQRAAELVTGTKLKDVALRRKLYEGGQAAIGASNDPMIALAKLVDGPARAARKVADEAEEVTNQAYGQIARVKFAVQGTDTYPDATFTLRLAFGPVRGYQENGKAVPAMTTFAGLYERAAEHKNRPPFDLPERWVKAKEKLNPSTPFNFVCTADIIGGNSGSPVVNKAGEVVGLIFDGNIQSLVLDYVYTEEQARAVSVCSPAMIESLRKVYDADALADELTGVAKK